MARFVSTRDVAEQQGRIRLDDIRSQAAMQEMESYRLDAPLRQLEREKARATLESMPQILASQQNMAVDEEINSAADAGDYNRVLDLSIRTGRVPPDSRLVHKEVNGIPAAVIQSPQGELIVGKSTRELVQETGADLFKEQQKPKARLLTPEESQSLGFPEDYIVQQKPDGGLDVTYKPSEGDQRDRKISELVSRGVPRDRASDLVDGRLRIDIVPETGMARLINEVNQTVEEIPIGGQPEEQPTLEGRSLWEQADDATGPVSAALAGSSRLLGNVGVPVAEETIQARQAFTTAMGDLRRGLSINPRFPVGEMERIEKEVDIKPSILDSPEALRQRMVQIDRSLRNRLKQYERDARDTSLPQDTRSAQAANASAIRNLITVMGVPQEATDAPEGVDPDLWRYMTPEQRKLWD